MNKSLKIILSMLVSLLLLVLLAIGAAILFINPNDFKPQIIAAVKENTGRELVIEGDLKLSFFPTLGLTTGKMTLKNTSEFQEHALATLEESQITVQLLPLLSKRVEINSIILKGLTLNLITNQQGLKNWQAINTTKPSAVANPSVSAQPSNALATFALGRLALVNAKINWQNLQTGKTAALNDLNLNSEKVAFNQPISFYLTFNTSHANNRYLANIKFNSVLTINEQFDNFSLARSHLVLIENVPEKSLTSTATINAEQLTFSLSQQNFKLTGLDIKSDYFTVKADITTEYIDNQPNLQGKINLVSSFKTLLQKSGLTLPVTADANAFNKLAIDTNISATKEAIKLDNLLITLDDTTIKGNIQAKKYPAPLNFNLTIDNLDLDRYLPPREKHNKAITSPTLALTVGIKQIPVELLKKTNAEIQMNLGKLKINDLNLPELQIHISAKEGVLTSNQHSNQFYQGEYIGHLVMDGRGQQPSLAIDEKISHVQIEPLLQDFKGKAVLRGTIDASAQLKGQGHTATELKASLNGFIKVACKDGSVLGFSLQKMLDKAKALLKGADLSVDASQDETPFSLISGTAVVHNGVINNQDLLAKNHKIQVNGAGTANLLTEQLDYKIKASIIKDPNTPEQTKEIPVAIAIGGTFDKPRYTLDISTLIEENKTKIEKVLEQHPETKAKIENALDKLKPEEKEKVKQLAPKLGKFFKKVF